MARSARFMLAVLVAFGLAALGCGWGPQPEDILRQRRVELESVATRWARGTSADFFIFSNESWRWDGKFIERRNNTYVVTGVQLGGELAADSLEDAARAVGTTDRELREWEGLLTDLHLRGIDKVSAGAIELNVEGYRRRAYGLLYVVPGHDEELARFLEHAKKGSIDGQYQDIRHIDGPWFYVFGSR